MTGAGNELYADRPHPATADLRQPQTISLSGLDLNAAVRDSTSLLAPTIGARINVVTHLAGDLRPVLAEPTNVAQILLNLAVNAADAMPDGGTLTIVTSNVDVPDDRREAGPPIPPARTHGSRSATPATG